MKQFKLTKFIHEKFILINYLLVTLFILSNLFILREYRDFIFTIFIGMMLPVLVLKLIEDRKIDKEKSNNYILKAFLSIFIIITLLVLFYIFMS